MNGTVNNTKKMKVLITGGSGFIGRNLSEGLKSTYDIFSPSHSELELTNNSEVRRYIEINKIEVVIHTAVHSSTASERDNGFIDDLQMLMSLVNNVDKLKKLIVFGSGAEYSKTRDMNKINEDEWGEQIPTDPYGLSKFVAHMIVKNEPKMINLRLFGVYGPREDYLNKFISNVIVKNLLGMPIHIKQDAIFDYLYIDDLERIVDHFVSHKTRYHDYNVTPTESIRLSEIVEIVNKLSDHPSNVEIINQEMNFSYTGNNSRLVEELPSFPFTSYDEGIKLLIEYYKSILPSLDITSIKNDRFLVSAKTKVGKT